mgnify:FL=1
MGDRRFMTTTQAADWLLGHYGMEVTPRKLLRHAKAGVIRSHQAHTRAWHTFSEASLREYAELQGFTPIR